MVRVVWLDSFETGVPEVDTDHRVLVKAAAEFQEAFSKGDRVDCLTHFESFVLLATDHFRREEAMLAEINYPNLAVHARTHRELLEKAEVVRASLADGCPDGDATRMLEELVEFLVADIMEADHEFKSWVHETPLVR